MNNSSSTPTPPDAPPPLPTGRPVAITVLCILGMIGAAFTIPMVFTNIARQIGPWYPPYLAFSALVGGICMVGYWKMRRWAVLTYTTFFVLNQVALFFTGHWNAFAILIPGIVIAIGFSYWSRMR
jgi:hypothetical protein